MDAVSFYVNIVTPLAPPLQRQASHLFMFTPGANTESLRVNACESLVSASVILSEFTRTLNTPYRNKKRGWIK